MVRVLDLFCGMGGLSLGFSLALEAVEIHGVDIDTHAVATYNLNLNRFGCWADVADLLTWSTDQEYDIVVGGPPCQPWSLANTKNSGDRHPLYPTFQRYFDIIKSTMPVAFVFENVRGLVTQKFKPLLDIQLRSLAETYRVKSAILNAVDYGVPQKRQRVIVVGIRRDVGVEPVLPQRTHDEQEIPRLDGGMYHKWLTIREAIGDLLDMPPTIMHRGHNGGLKTSIVSPDSPSYTVGAMSGGGRGRNTMYLLTDHITAEKKLIRTNPRHGKPVDMDGPSRTVKVDGRGGDFCFDTMLLPLDVPATAILGDRRLRPPGHHNTLSEECLVPVGPIKWEAVVQPSATVVADARIYPSGRREHGSDLEKGVYRRLTVRECMRLQSFPDWWVFPKDVSTSKRYKLVGEAVPPILAYRIAVDLGKALGMSVKEPPQAEDWDLPYFRRAFADYCLNGV